MVSNLTQILELMSETARLEGKNEGTLETKTAITKKMFAKNMTEDLIAELTGLTPDKIREIKAKIENEPKTH